MFSKHSHRWQQVVERCSCSAQKSSSRSSQKRGETKCFRNRLYLPWGKQEQGLVRSLVASQCCYLWSSSLLTDLLCLPSPFIETRQQNKGMGSGWAESNSAAGFLLCLDWISPCIHGDRNPYYTFLLHQRVSVTCKSPNKVTVDALCSAVSWLKAGK